MEKYNGNNYINGYNRYYIGMLLMATELQLVTMIGRRWYVSFSGDVDLLFFLYFLLFIFSYLAVSVSRLSVLTGCVHLFLLCVPITPHATSGGGGAIGRR